MYYRHIRRMWLLAVPVLLLCEAATAQRNVPSPPTGLTIEIIEPQGDPVNGFTPYGVELMWNGHPAERVDSYNLYVKRLNECMAGNFELFLSTQETRVVLTAPALDIGNAGFVYYVTAVNAEGESAPSNMVSSACGRPWNEGDISDYNGTGTSQIVSDPPLAIELGGRYEYDVNTVADFSDEADYSPVYTLVRGPEGMTIDPKSGRIHWMPEAPGLYSVAVGAEIPELDESDQQAWRVTVSASVSSVADRGAAAVPASVYPNPNAGRATLRFASTGGERTISLIDSRGAEVWSATVRTTSGMNTVALDLDDKAPGAYVAIVRGGEESTTLPLQLVR